MKRFAAYVAVVGATLTGLFLLWQLRLVVGVFLLSLLVSAAVRPVISRLSARGLPRAAAMAITYIAVLLLLGLGFFLFSGPLVGELDLLADRLTVIYEILYPAWQEGSAFQQAVAERLLPPERLYDMLAAREGQFLAQQLFAATRTVVTGVSGLILVLVLSVYWSADQAHFERLWLSLLAPDQRQRGREIWWALEVGMGRYVRNEGALSFLAFLLLLLVYAATGINYPILLAVLGALAWLIPIVGFLFTLVPAFLGGLTSGLTVAVALTVYTALLLLVLEFVVERSLFRRRRVYSPILVILLIIPLAAEFGLLGFVIAPPLAVAIQILLASLFSRRRLQVEAVYPSSQVSLLQERLDALRKDAPDSSPELENLMKRLQTLLVKVEESLEELPLSVLESATTEAGEN